MPLRLVTGRANSGKTGVAYDLVRSVAADSGRVLLILPTVPDVARARAELAHTTPLGVTVTTFDSAVITLWADQGDGRAITSSHRRNLVLAGQARSQGASRAIARLAGDCVEVITEHSGIAWRDVSDPPLARGADLARLISGYARYLSAESLVEPHEAAHLLAEKGERAADLVVVHRFSDFTVPQIALIESWAEHSDVLVTLTWEEGFAPTRALTDIANRSWSNIHKKVEKTNPDTIGFEAGVAGELFDTDLRLTRNDGVRFCLADGAYAEARGVAEEVAAALANGQASSAERVAVVYRDLQSHAEPLRAAFAEAHIPAQIDVARSLALAPLGAAVIAAIDFALAGERRALLSLIRSPFSGLEPPQARQIEASCRRGGTTAAGALIDQIAVLQPRLGRALKAVRRAGRSPSLSALEVADLFELTSVLYRNGRDLDDGPDSQHDASSERAIADVLNEVSTGGLQVTLADVAEALRSLPLSAETVELAGRVQVMSATRVRSRRFDVVIIGGLNLGEFPAPPSELMLPGGAVDAIVRTFCGCGRQFKGPDYDHLLFYEATTRARNRLVLSAQRLDEDGEMRALSPLYEGVADRYRAHDDDCSEAEFADRYTAGLESPTDTVLPGQRGARAQVLVGCGEDDRMAAAARRARHVPGGRVEQTWTERPVSPSQIESYLACPYRWFYERVLRPQELERTFDARGEGEFSHLLLADTYRILIESERVPLTPTLLAFADAILDEQLATRLSSMPEPGSLAEQIGRRRSAAWARRILREDAEHTDGFVPTLVEWSFGIDDEPVVLEGFALAGRLDRLDVDGTGRALVVDYKRSCGVEHGATRMLTDGKIQLPLYLAAVRERLGLEPAGGLYRGLSTPAERGAVRSDAVEAGRGTRTDRLDAEGLARLLDDAILLASEAVDGMRAGSIETRPRTKASCRGCPAAATCGGRQ